MSAQTPKALRELRHALFTLRRFNQSPRTCRVSQTSSPDLQISRNYSNTSSFKTSSSAAHSSVDASEVSHFNALASSWWDPHGPSRLLHLMNPLRHDFIARCRSSQPNATTLPCSEEGDGHGKLEYLDIGCGGGIFAESAARMPHTASVTAIDPSAEVLEVARRHARRDPSLQEPSRLTYLNTSIEGLSEVADASGRPLAASQFDIVTLFEVLEHIRCPSPFLSTVLPRVRPGGWLVGSTIARTWTSWFTTKVVAEDVIGIVPKGTHDWDKYVNPHELKAWFRKREELGEGSWEEVKIMEVVYVPGLGWREVAGLEGVGNYFFGVKRES